MENIPQTESSKLFTLREEPDEPTERKKCLWVLEKGSNEGEVCNRNTFAKNDYCAAHQLCAKRRDDNKLKIETEDYEDIEEIEEIEYKPHINNIKPIIETLTPQINTNNLQTNTERLLRLELISKIIELINKTF